jgi:hypothetical protein
MSDNNLVPQIDHVRELDMSDNGTALVPRKATADLVEFEGDSANTSAPTLPQALAHLGRAIAGMGSADDVSVDWDQDRTRTRFRMRAYKHR